MKIFLATWLEDNQGKSLTENNNVRRLMSYYFIKTGSKNFDLKRYVEGGKLEPNRRIIEPNKFQRKKG